MRRPSSVADGSRGERPGSQRPVAGPGGGGGLRRSGRRGHLLRSAGRAAQHGDHLGAAAVGRPQGVRAGEPRVGGVVRGEVEPRLAEGGLDAALAHQVDRVAVHPVRREMEGAPRPRPEPDGVGGEQAAGDAAGERLDPRPARGGERLAPSARQVRHVRELVELEEVGRVAAERARDAGQRADGRRGAAALDLRQVGGGEPAGLLHLLERQVEREPQAADALPEHVVADDAAHPRPPGRGVRGGRDERGRASRNGRERDARALAGSAGTQGPAPPGRPFGGLRAANSQTSILPRAFRERQDSRPRAPLAPPRPAALTLGAARGHTAGRSGTWGPGAASAGLHRDGMESGRRPATGRSPRCV